MQPASREQIVAIIRQRAERHRDRAALGVQGAEANPGAAANPVGMMPMRMMGPAAAAGGGGNLPRPDPAVAAGMNARGAGQGGLDYLEKIPILQVRSYETRPFFTCSFGRKIS